MTDIWSFLLQTMTATGAAAVLLALKALLRDKLSPRWQYGVWGVLVLVLLLPAGLGGRYTLLNWPLWVETAKTALTGDYTLTRVAAPVPLPDHIWPVNGFADGLYLLYLAGVVCLLLRYAVIYFRLRLALRTGVPTSEEQVRRVAERYGLHPCRAIEVTGISTAFVCGVLRPVLVLPAGKDTDDKVILHELLHLKHHDAAWSLLICLLRCIHWCNPLLWHCANRALNDGEALCDQRVLERLEGEARRDYGRILLEMACEAYARVPGTTSMANGGKNISHRIEAIARFKRYPAGMALASVCVAVIIALPMTAGEAQGIAPSSGIGATEDLTFHTAMASARVASCTTAAGALDTYGKAVLYQNGIYRALCAPLSEHPALASSMNAAASGPDQWVHEHWESGLHGVPDTEVGYLFTTLSARRRGIMR